MKKLFVLLALVVLSTMISYALPWSDAATNNFTAYVVCQPSLTGDADFDAGDFFVGQTWTGPHSMVFTLSGGATETTPEVFAITYTNTGSAEWSGSWDATPSSVTIEGQCGTTHTFTYTMNGATWTSTGSKTFTVGISASLSSY